MRSRPPSCGSTISCAPRSPEGSPILVATLTAPQRIAFHEMLMAAMSSQGYAKSAAIMWLDDILRAEESGRLADLGCHSDRAPADSFPRDADGRDEQPGLCEVGRHHVARRYPARRGVRKARRSWLPL